MGVRSKLMVLAVLLLTYQCNLSQGYIELNTSVKLIDFSPTYVYVSPYQNLYLLGWNNDLKSLTPAIYIIEQNGTISNMSNITCVSHFDSSIKYVSVNNTFLANRMFGDNISIWQYNMDFDIEQSYNISISDIYYPSGYHYFEITEQGNLYLFFVEDFYTLNYFAFHIYKLNLEGDVIWQVNYNVTLDESFPLDLAFRLFKYSIQEPYIATCFWKDLVVINANDGKILWQKKFENQILGVGETVYGPIIAYETKVNNVTKVAITSFANPGLKLWTRYLSSETYFQLLELEFFVKQNIVAVKQSLLIAKELQTVQVDYFELFNEEGTSLGSISKCISSMGQSYGFFLMSEQVCGVVCNNHESDDLGNSHVETEIELYRFTASGAFSTSNYVAIALGSIILIGVSVVGVKKLVQRKT